MARRPIHCAREEVRFAGDSPLEGDGFEPSVPRQVFLAAPSIHAQFTFRNINRLARDRDRGFESISLQERVCKLSVPRAPIVGARGFDPMAGRSCGEGGMLFPCRSAQFPRTA